MLSNRQSRIAAVTALLGFGLVACSDADQSPVGPISASIVRGTAGLTPQSLAGPCGLEQLRNAPPVNGSGTGSIPNGVVPLSGPPIQKNRVIMVHAQWDGWQRGFPTHGYSMISSSSPAWGCVADGGMAVQDLGPASFITDSLSAIPAPDGVDPLTWAMIPPAVRRLLLDLAWVMVYQKGACVLPEVGEMACWALRNAIVQKLTDVFNSARERSHVDFSIADDEAQTSQYPNRSMRYSEFLRTASFSMGCALTGRLAYLPGFEGFLSPAESEEWGSKITGSFMTINLPPSYRYLERQLGGFASGGAQRGRAGDSCLNALQVILRDPQGNNMIFDDGMNSGGGDGGTQF
jgi:hypothetical protein